ncbi:hypothetical protein BDV98DRAFT_232047 [Pterulicium gracile]|uniref:Uncharacterized protein n=1 Tax=Pterulicium gracile TaxID=1884261 RepID=A0A5C3QY69_9AGAR|nr:hypothetical protein BDV98DRAFT_232047 [Pterula gracilis]
MMVSGFICERYGNQARTESLIEANARLPLEEQLAVTDSRVIICPNGKETGDNYWNMDQMIEQLKNAIKIARRLFSNAIIHWVFDNSSCHGSLPHDAITDTKMNVGPGGKAPCMKDTVIPDDNPFGKGGQTQCLQFPSDLPPNHEHYNFRGLPKGMKILAAECGYDVSKLIGQCATCKLEHSWKPHLDLTPHEIYLADEADGNDSGEEDERPFSCCLRRLLENQGDIKNQTSLLQEIVEEAGYKCHFLPKFHPELNPIETAHRLLDEALAACPLITIRRFFRRSGRYLSVYQQGATGYLAEFAVRKYASHRSVTRHDLDEAEKAWKLKQLKDAKKKLFYRCFCSYMIISGVNRMFATYFTLYRRPEKLRPTSKFGRGGA